MRTRRVRTRGEQERYRHWIEYGDKRQSEQPDRSFQVCCRRANQLGEISDGADFGLCARALGVDPRLTIYKLASA